jgi:hypothetical protein
VLGKGLREAYARLGARLLATVTSPNLDPFLNAPLHVPALSEMREAARKKQKRATRRTKSGKQIHRAGSIQPTAAKPNVSGPCRT